MTWIIEYLRILQKGSQEEYTFKMRSRSWLCFLKVHVILNCSRTIPFQRMFGCNKASFFCLHQYLLSVTSNEQSKKANKHNPNEPHSFTYAKEIFNMLSSEPESFRLKSIFETRSLMYIEQFLVLRAHASAAPKCLKTLKLLAGPSWTASQKPKVHLKDLNRSKRVVQIKLWKLQQPLVMP